MDYIKLISKKHTPSPSQEGNISTDNLAPEVARYDVVFKNVIANHALAGCGNLLLLYGSLLGVQSKDSLSPVMLVISFKGMTVGLNRMEKINRIVRRTFSEVSLIL